jgi:hypothetical protein
MYHQVDHNNLSFRTSSHRPHINCYRMVYAARLNAWTAASAVHRSDPSACARRFLTALLQSLAVGGIPRAGLMGRATGRVRSYSPAPSCAAGWPLSLLLASGSVFSVGSAPTPPERRPDCWWLWLYAMVWVPGCALVLTFCGCCWNSAVWVLCWASLF